MALTGAVFLFLLTARGMNGLKWLSGPDPASDVGGCLGEELSLRWTYNTSKGETVRYVQWLFTPDLKQEAKPIATVDSGWFAQYPTTKTKMEYLPNAGIRLNNITDDDLGIYTVGVGLVIDGRFVTEERTVHLHRADTPELQEDRLVASFLTETVSEDKTPRVQLFCGTIMNHHAKFSVTWKTPSLQVLPSSFCADGIYSLTVDNPAWGGTYSCQLKAATGKTCFSIMASVVVYKRDARMLELETELSNISGTVNEVSSELAVQRNVHTEISGILDNLTSDHENLKQVVNSLGKSKELTDLKSRVAQQQTASESQQREIKDIKTRLEQQEIASASNTLREKLESQSKELTDLKSRVTQQQTTSESQQREIIDVNTRLKQQEQTVANTLVEELGIQNNKLADLKSLVTQQQRETTSRVERQEQAIAGLSFAFDKLLISLMSSCQTMKAVLPSSGVRTLLVATTVIPVYCDQTTAGGGWTVIQRRVDGSVSFNRNWAEYEEGFGDLQTEFWLGLRNIHRLTTARSYRLRVDLSDFRGNVAYAVYDTFYIDGPDNNYKLHVGGYSGTAGDSFSHHSGRLFSTPDRENDIDPSRNCGVVSSAGWWFRACIHAGLNGPYGTAQDTDTWFGWLRWHGDWRSLKTADMKIRPKD